MAFPSSIFIKLGLCLIFIAQCNSYRILGVFPMPARSHYILGGTLMKALSDAGHDVTVLTPFAEKYTSKSGTWREIILDENHNVFKDANLTNNTGFTLSMFVRFITQLTVVADMTLSHPEVQDLMTSKQKFDVVIVSEFMLDSLKCLAPHFDAHLVGFSNSGYFPYYYDYIGNRILPSHYPEIMLGFTPDMTLPQRIINTLARTARLLSDRFLMLPNQEEVAKKHFPHINFQDVLYNISLVLVNNNPGIYPPQPTVPLMKDIGGFHLKPVGQLPEDLQKLMDNAKNGVIYFSLGSHIRSEELKEEKRNAILKVLGKRKEIVLWKWGEDTMPGKPDNVILKKWFPQQEVLAHPNLKLFISHGGLLSTSETIYHGVPTVTIPILGDQKLNAKFSAAYGYGIPVFLEDLNEETFDAAVDTVISNPKYKEVLKGKSKIMKDKLNPPLKEAIYWVEYVVRHNGAKHLRVPYAQMPWYQFYLFDIIGIILVTTVTVLWVVKKIVCFFVGLCWKKSKKVKTS